MVMVVRLTISHIHILLLLPHKDTMGGRQDYRVNNNKHVYMELINPVPVSHVCLTNPSTRSSPVNHLSNGKWGRRREGS